MKKLFSLWTLALAVASMFAADTAAYAQTSTKISPTQDGQSIPGMMNHWAAPDGSSRETSVANPMPVTIPPGTPLQIQQVDGAAVTTTNGTAANAVLFSINTNGYGGIAFQLTGTWAGTVTFQESDDGITFNGATAQSQSGASVTSASANGMWFKQAQHLYFRAVITAYTSGTVSSVAYLRTQQNIAYSSGITNTLAAGNGANNVGGTTSVSYFNELSTVLAASASNTPTSRDLGTTAIVIYNSFNCFVNTDQGGTLTVQASNDNTLWFNEATAPIVANTPLLLTQRITTRYHRCLETNGATLQTVNKLNSSFGQ